MQPEASLSSYGLPFSSKREGPPMTLQIGMLGCDGIVVVGDTWQYVEPEDQRSWYGYNASKFRVATNNRLAVACAHDMDASFAVAEEVFQRLSEPGESRRTTILDIGARVAEGRDSECLIVFADPYPSIYRFCHAKTGEQKCEEIYGCMAIGDHGNPACYWAMRFYNGGLSCQQLSRLGSLVVVSAGELNKGSIGGLEGFICDTGGIRLWSREESNLLENEMKNLENGFRGTILAS